MIKVKRALISLSDKKGIIPFAKGLAALGIEILSTGGTAKQLKHAGLSVREVSDYTDFPEILDGRVKTLHPKIYAGILALRENPAHQQQMEQQRIGFIDMVVCNLYPFESAIKKKHITLEEALKNIDIGGPAMLRAAAKNFKNVAVICDPGRYTRVLKELQNSHGLLSDTVLFSLALEAFKHTARYDAIISQFFNQRLKEEDFSRFPREITLKFTKCQELRYGENPHQRAALYKDMEGSEGFPQIKQLQGKELSFNNILDLQAAVECVKDFSQPTAVIIKHNTPTGLAADKKLVLAFQQALRCDPVSAFGGIIGLNQNVEEQTAKAIVKSGFMECVVAPSFDRSTLKIFTQKPKLSIIAFDFNISQTQYDLKKVFGGLLLQEQDRLRLSRDKIKVVTQKKPTAGQLESMMFGWQAVKYVKSNAIVLVKGSKTIGIGAGQTSRVESVRLAIAKANKNARGAVLISDGFFPKIDNIELAAKAGIKGIIQPGGSIADPAVIAQADKSKIAMVFTGIRHFKH